MIYFTTFDHLNIICHNSWSEFGKSMIDIHHNIWSFDISCRKSWPEFDIYEWSTSRHLTIEYIICHYIPNSWPEFDNLWKIYITTYNHLNIICRISWPEFDNLWKIYITTYNHVNIIWHKFGLSLINLKIIYITTYDHLNIICHKSWPEFDIYE